MTWNNTQNISPPQRMTPLVTPTSTSLPWKQLNEWGRSMFRAERTGWLSWRAGGEGHRADSVTPNSKSPSEQFSTAAPSDSSISWKAVVPIAALLTHTHRFARVQSFPQAIHSTTSKKYDVGGLSAAVILWSATCLLVFVFDRKLNAWY